MTSARTVKEAFDVFARLASRAYEGNEYFVKPDGDTTWLVEVESGRLVWSTTIHRRATSTATT